MPAAKNTAPSAATPLPAEIWRSLRHEWLWVYRAPVPHHGEWSLEIPVPAGVFFVEQGEVRIQADGKEEIRVPRGHAFFSAPGLRRQWFAPRTQLLSAGFRSQWPDGTPLYRSGLNLAAKAPRLRQATLQLFHTIHRGRKSVTYRQATTAQTAAQPMKQWLLHEAAYATWMTIFATTLQTLGVPPEPRSTPGRRRVDQLTTWLNSRPLDQTAPTLPPGFPLGPRRAEQLLQQHLGLGQRAFLERRRLDAARELITGTNTLKEIAFALGFRHASHFTAWFRRHTGLSPSSYRSGGVEAA